MKSIAECWSDLDKWLLERRNIIPKFNPYKWKGTIQRADWVSDDFIPRDVSRPEWINLCNTITQNEKEIKDFINVVVEKKLTNSILEIGAGFFGGTHAIWRQFFTTVYTIECETNLVDEILSREQWQDDKSHFILGRSESLHTQNEVQKILQGVDAPLFFRQQLFDVVFIDGNHSLASVSDDYNNYKNYCKKGGIIAFHDSLSYGIIDFIKELEKTKKVFHIVRSVALGICYIVNE